MDILNELLNYIARTNLFNFVIFLAIIVFVAKKLNISLKIESAKESVKDTIVESETVKVKSEETLSGVEESFKNLNDEIDSIVRQSEDNADLVGEKILKDADKNALTIKENTDKIIENNRLILKNDILRRAALASVEVAKAHIKEELTRNSSLHDKLIDESLSAIEGTEV